MAEVDASIYKLPTQPSPLELADKIGGIAYNAQARPIAIEQQQNTLDKSKLDLVNQKWGIINKELSTMAGDPNITFDDVAKRTQGLVNQGLIDPKMNSEFLKQLPTDQKLIPRAIQTTLERGQDNVTALNWHYGQQSSIGNGQTVTPVVGSAKPGFGGTPGVGGFRPTSLPIQQQVPPTAQGVTETGAPAFVGPQSPQNAPGTVAQPTPINTSPLPVGTTKLPDGSIRTVGQNKPPLPVGSPTPAQRVDQGFANVPRGPATGFAPGVAEAENISASASGTALGKARDQAANYQRDIFPLQQAIPALEKLGTKGTGPGTETLNHLKSFTLSMIPGIKETDPTFASVPTFDKAKKYLTDFVNQTGNSGTNDKLAAAFAGNPSVGISNAAAVDVAKSALALRRMQQAQIQEFERLGLPANQYSRWIAKQNNEMDPRAFGVDMMSPEARQKLLKDLKGKERDRFEKSLEIAHGLQFVTPPSGQ